MFGGRARLSRLSLSGKHILRLVLEVGSAPVSPEMRPVAAQTVQGVSRGRHRSDEGKSAKCCAVVLAMAGERSF